MTRKILLLFLIVTVVVAVISITGGVRESDRSKRIATAIASFAGTSLDHSFERAVGTEKKLAGYGEEAVPMLIEQMNASVGYSGPQRALVRGGCARALARIEHAKAAPALMELLRAEHDAGAKGDWFVLASAIYGIGIQRYQPAEPLLIRLAADRGQHLRVRQQAIIALARVSADDHRTEFVELFRTEPVEIMKGVVTAFHSMNGSGGPDDLLATYLYRGQDRRPGTNRESLRILADLLYLIVAKAEDDTSSEQLSENLEQVFAWKWDAKAVRLNSLNFADRVGTIDTAELLASLCLARTYRLGNVDGMTALLDRALQEEPTVSADALPMAVARFFAQLKAQGPAGERANRANQTARTTIGKLVELLGRDEPAARRLAIDCLAKAGLSDYPFDPDGPEAERNSVVQQYETWWQQKKDNFKL